MPEERLRALAEGHDSVLEVMAQMQLGALERSGLDEETYLLVRLAALVATDAGPASYRAQLRAAGHTRLSMAKMLGALVAIAPVVGSARVFSAASTLARRRAPLPRRRQLTSQPALALEPKLRPQLGTGTQVRRTALLDLLEASSRMPVAAIIAPPGYGKTTLLAQWAERDQRAFAWLTIDRRDNDPSVLLRNLVAACDQVTPADRDALELEDDPGAAIDAVLPRLGSALSTAGQPAVLVLDDIHLLQNWAGLDAVARLIEYLPGGSQLAIASRGEPPLPLARLRAEGRVVEVGPGDLAMDTAEASALLEHGDGRASAGSTWRSCCERTEGWPVALHFAAKSLGAGGRGAAKAATPAPDDRLMAGYLEFELLSRLPPGLVSFLTRCSVLEGMSGPLCDAVLATSGSGDLLESLSRSDLLVLPLDRRRQWYRLHRLLRELLRAELERREPTLAVELTRRAAEWCERPRAPRGRRSSYAMAAGDADRAARLVVDVTLPTYARRPAGAAHPVVRLVRDPPAGRAVPGRRRARRVDRRGRRPPGRRPALGRRRGEATPDGIGSPGGPLDRRAAGPARGGTLPPRGGADGGRRRAGPGAGADRQRPARVGAAAARDLPAAGRRPGPGRPQRWPTPPRSARTPAPTRRWWPWPSGPSWPWPGGSGSRPRPWPSGHPRAPAAPWLEQYPSGALLHAVTARLAIHDGDRPPGQGRPGPARTACAGG